MKVNADLHNHLKTGSDMSRLPFNYVLDVANERLGDKGILGLINFNDARYEQFSGLPGYERVDFGNALYFPEPNIFVVKGQEVQTKEGHLLVMGIQKNKHLRSGEITIEDAIKEADDNNGIKILDHPFFKEGAGEHCMQHPEILDSIDALEVHNGEAALYIPGVTPMAANKKTRKFYDSVSGEHSNLGAIQSSDGHSIAEIGTSYSTLNFPFEDINTSEDVTKHLRKAVREHRYEGKVSDSMFRGLLHIAALAYYVMKD
jgi:hypothetical protein